MATLPHVWYANFGDGSTTGYYAVAPWATATAYTVGQTIRQKTTPAVGNERCFVVVTAGTSSATTEPTWALGNGTKTTDAGGPVYMECTGQPSLNGDVPSTPASSVERSTSVSLGLIIKNNSADHYFICTTASFLTSASEPTYNTTPGATTADSTGVWTCLGAVGSFTAWGAPQPRVGFTNALAGDTIYVSAIHAETSTSTISISLGTLNSSTITKLICVSNTPSLPPVAADFTTGATISTTGSVSPITFGQGLYVEGVAFNCGTSGAQSLSVAASAGSYVFLKNCALNLGGAGQALILGGNSKIVMVNTTIQFSGNTSAVQLGGHIVWRDTASAISKLGGSWPTTFCSSASSSGGDILFENIDLSAFAGTAWLGANSGAFRWVMKNCAIPNLATPVTTASLSGPRSGTLDFVNCDSGGNTYQHAHFGWEGSQTVDTSATRTSGASDGTTSFAWKIVTSANSAWLIPFECMPITIWNPVTAANVTVSIEGAYNGATLPNNDEIWLETTYFGTAFSTFGTRKSQTKSGVVSSNAPLTASSAIWGASAPARQNNNAYALGDEIGVSSAGSITRLFICTTAGTSSGSLPGAYATTDGNSVTDGTAVFRAVMRFKLQVVLTSPQPQTAGYLTCYAKAALASSTYWIDPLVTLT